MQTENQTSKIKPADRLASVSEYYFSKKLKEVAQMNAEGKDVISLGIGSPDMMLCNGFWNSYLLYGKEGRSKGIPVL